MRRREVELWQAKANALREQVKRLTVRRRSQSQTIDSTQGTRDRPRDGRRDARARGQLTWLQVANLLDFVWLVAQRLVAVAAFFIFAVSDIYLLQDAKKKIHDSN